MQQHPLHGHSCSLLFLPCIFEHGCTSHHRESGMVRPRHVTFIHVLFSFSLASSSMDARLITGSLGMVRPRHVTFIHVLFKKELTCDFSPSTRMLAAGRFINLGKKELTRDFTPSMGLFQCNNHCRHYKKAWDKIASSLLKPEGCPGGA